MNVLRNTLFAITLLSFASCKKDKNVTTTPETGSTGSVAMQFDNYVGNDPLVLNSATYYKNAHGDDFKVTRYKYYISNIVLNGDNGTTFVEPESYHLIDQETTSSLSFAIDKVPVGNYKSVTVMIGVDKRRNTAGAQTGALDPANGMFWTWSTGYIMAKMEGTSPQATTGLAFHISGFDGQYSVIKTVTLPFSQNMVVSSAGNNKITIKSDLLTWFKSPNMIDFSTLSVIGSVGPDAAAMAQNYETMLSVTSVH